MSTPCPYSPRHPDAACQAAIGSPQFYGDEFKNKMRRPVHGGNRPRTVCHSLNRQIKLHQSKILHFDPHRHHHNATHRSPVDHLPFHTLCPVIAIVIVVVPVVITAAAAAARSCSHEATFHAVDFLASEESHRPPLPRPILLAPVLSLNDTLPPTLPPPPLPRKTPTPPPAPLRNGSPNAPSPPSTQPPPPTQRASPRLR